MYNLMYGCDNMQILLVFGAYMLLFYSTYKITFWLKGRRKKRDLYKIMEIDLLENHFKVEVRKIKIEKLLNLVALSNSVIFAIVLMSTMLITNFIIRILAMFVLLMPLIYLVYYGVSKYLQSKGDKK